MKKKGYTKKEKREKIEKECLIAAYDALKTEDGRIDVLAAYVAARKRERELKEKLKIKDHLFIDLHHICASAVYAEHEDLGEVTDVHPYCNGATLFLDFARAAICIDHMSNILSLLDSDEELFGGAEEAEGLLKLINKDHDG